MNFRRLTPTLRAHWPILLILTTFLLLGGGYALVNPLHEATDELRHYRFVRYLIVNKALPVQGEEPCRSQSHHPPLFYIAAALVTAGVDGGNICATPPTNPFWQYRYWEVGVDNKAQYFHGPEEAFPWRGDALAAHLARGVNLLFGAATVWLTWAIGLAVWPTRHGVAALAAALVAFNPMFIYLAAAINNDIVAAAAGALITLTLVRLLQDPQGLTPRSGLVVGLAYGLGLLSKTSLLAFGLPIALTGTWIAWRRRQWRQWVIFGLLSLGGALLVSGWWFVRNVLVYGDPTGFQRLTELWGVRNPAESVPLVVQEIPYAWTTLWGRFGFGQIPLPDAFYREFLFLTVVGGAAWLAQLQPRVRRHFAGDRAGTGLLLVVAVTALLVWINYMLVSPAGPMGRFFFPGLPAFTLLLAAGLLTPLRAWRPRLAAALALLGGARIFSLALLALLLYLRPAYVQPQGFDTATLGEKDTRSGARFDSLVRVVGYRVATPGDVPLQPGGVLTVDLYLEVLGRPPGDYVFFVHLLDGAGTMVAQRDTYSGLGRFPSGQWQPGDRFVESIQLHLPETASAPEQLAVRVGFYAPGSFRLAVFAADDAPLGDSLLLAEEVPLAAGSPLAVSFEEQLLLRDVDFGRRVLAAGDEVAVTLTWERLPGQADPLDVRLELLDEAGNLRQQVFQRVAPGPAGGLTQTLTIPLPADLQPGQYRPVLALVSPDEQRLLNVVGEDGRWITALLDLPRIRVAQ